MTSLLYRAFAKAQDATTRLMYGAEKHVTATSFYDCVDRNMDGNEVPMSTFKGNVVIVVNVGRLTMLSFFCTMQKIPVSSERLFPVTHDVRLFYMTLYTMLMITRLSFLNT
jgi:hypothetical protein